MARIIQRFAVERAGINGDDAILRFQ